MVVESVGLAAPVGEAIAQGVGVDRGVRGGSLVTPSIRATPSETVTVSTSLAWMASRMAAKSVAPYSVDELALPVTSWWKVRMSQLPSRAASLIHVRTVSTPIPVCTSWERSCRTLESLKFGPRFTVRWPR
ncbi:MAG: hypothetical protein ABW123_15395 [Cystobacter sp.]